MAIRILTDSAADYEKQELIDKGISMVPLSINFKDAVYQDGINLTKEEFYEKLLKGDDFPMTAQPSPEAFLTYFKAAKEAGDAVVAILLAGGLSGTYQSAMIAKNMVDYEDIYVIDSLTAVTGLRLLVDIALDMRSEGSEASEIAARMEELRTRVKIVAMVDTLEYLHRGGRLTKTQAKLGELANLKPIISLDHKEGKIFVQDKCLGRGRAYKRLMAAMEKFPSDRRYPTYFVYSHNKTNCEKFVEMAAKSYEYIDQKHMYNIGPTIGTHVGGGAFGMSFILGE